MSTKKNDVTVETSLKNLEDIVKKLESNTEDLSASLKLYEEGIGEVNRCKEMLEQAKLKITQLADNDLN